MRVLDALDQYDLEEQPEDLIGEIQDIFFNDAETQNQPDLQLQFMRLIYRYLEERLDDIQDDQQDRFVSLSNLSLSCLGNDYSPISDEEDDGNAPIGKSSIEHIHESRFHATAYSLLRKLIQQAVRFHNEAFFFRDTSAEEMQLFNDIDETLLKESTLKIDSEHPLAIMLVDILESSLYSSNEDNFFRVEETNDFLVTL